MSDVKGCLFVVSTPIGNLKDLSQNAKECLSSVDLIAAEDTRNSKVLINHIGSKVKMISHHKFNEESSTLKIIEELKSGKNVALITDAGTPCISDPGSILVNEAIKNNIDVFSVPGACAVISALTVSGFNINSFTFYGFLPRETGKLSKKLNEIKHDSSLVAVLYESPKRIKKLLKLIIDILDNPKICLCNELTKKFEKKYYGYSSSVLELLNQSNVSELGEYVLVIRKNEIKNDNENKISLESQIIDKMVKENITIKDAIEKIKSENESLSKKEIYDASLRLKSILLKNAK